MANQKGKRNVERNNEGAIWGNTRKEKDTHPDFTGNAVVDGVEYKIAAWKRRPDANPKAPSLKFKFEKAQIDIEEEIPDAE
jgi:hypothetical protein